jgi:cysteine desulfurase / selenocysteine lyase
MIYFNTASCGLLSKESVSATNELYNAMLTESSTAAEALRETGIPRIRETVASFLAVPPANIAFIPNFSYALCCIVQAFKGFEKVMLFKDDYPSVLESFRINNFDITWIDSADGFSIDIEEVKQKLIAHKVQILVISQVQWLSGFKIDIVELGSFCRANDIIFIVDATQSLGAVRLRIDQMHVDVLISSNYKWMNAGFGTGVMYMSDSFLAKYPPVVGGFGSYGYDGRSMKYMPSVRSYEPGHPNFHGLLVLEAAVNEKLTRGMDAIAAHNQSLTQLLLDNIGDTPILGPATTGNRSSIVMLRDDSGSLHKHLTASNFLAIHRNGNIRLSFHFYNTEDEVNQLIDCLSAFKG